MNEKFCTDEYVKVMSFLNKMTTSKYTVNGTVNNQRPKIESKVQINDQQKGRFCFDNEEANRNCF